MEISLVEHETLHPILCWVQNDILNPFILHNMPEESKWYPTRRKSPRVDLTKLTSRL